MIYKNEIFFLEEPLSEDASMVADAMRRFFEAMVDRDSKRLLPLFSDDAKIYLYTASDNKFVSRSEYAQEMEHILSLLKSFQLFDLSIRAGEEAATVSGFARYRYADGSNKVWRRKWKLKKGDGGWLITESLVYPIK